MTPKTPRNTSKAISETKGCKKRKTKKRKDLFSLYIYRVLKQVHPNSGVSSKAVSIMNSLINDLLENISREASCIAHYNRRSTITSREIQTAVRLLLPGELGKHAIAQGIKSLFWKQQVKHLS